MENPKARNDMVADWWGISGKGEKKIAEELNHQAETIQKEYAKKIVLEQTAADGFDLVSGPKRTTGPCGLLSGGGSRLCNLPNPISPAG